MRNHEPASKDGVLSEQLRWNLVRAGLFLAGWELLKLEVTGKVREFFQIGFDAGNWRYSHKYATRVLARHRRFEASLQWIVEHGGLTSIEVTSIRQLRVYRNELPRLLTEPDYFVDTSRIIEIRDLLFSLGRFWRRVEDNCNDQFGRDLGKTEIASSMVAHIDRLIDQLKAEEVGPRLSRLRLTQR